MNQTIIITPDGKAATFDEFPFELGPVDYRRVSHILPANPVKRLAFRTLRFVFGERGRIASWTRRWRTTWTLRMANEPSKVLFTHISRRVVLDYERRLLNERTERSGSCEF